MGYSVILYSLKWDNIIFIVVVAYKATYIHIKLINVNWSKQI